MRKRDRLAAGDGARGCAACVVVDSGLGAGAGAAAGEVSFGFPTSSVSWAAALLSNGLLRLILAAATAFALLASCRAQHNAASAGVKNEPRVLTLPSWFALASYLTAPPGRPFFLTYS